MEKRAEMQEQSKAKDQESRKSWPELEEEEESKEVKVQKAMQPQDYVRQIVESGKQEKIYKITKAYKQEMADIKKTMNRMKQIKDELKDLTEKYQKNVLERTDELEQLGHLVDWQSKEFSKKILDLSRLVPPIQIETSMTNLET